jgi:hypothetical protein
MGFGSWIDQTLGVPDVKGQPSAAAQFASHPASSLYHGTKDGLGDAWDKSGLGDITDILKAIPLFLVVGGGLFLVNELVDLV